VACETTYVFFTFFNVFFSKSKKRDFLRFFEWLTTFSRTLRASCTQWTGRGHFKEKR